MISAILTDIEGTTSSISFVKETLFPYAAEQLPSFVREHEAEEAVSLQLNAVASATGIAGNDLEGQILQLLEWIDSDTKATPLKALQGMIWKAGYECGDYRAHFYPDAVKQMTLWRERGIPIYVYSSGSIQAQRLFFKYSSFGDLRPLISGWFDTTTGAKQEARSYQKIQQEVSIPAPDMLFLSDIEAELDAAKKSGLSTVLVARAQDSTPSDSNAQTHHQVVDSFDQIEF